MSIFTLDRSYDASGTLQILYEGRSSSYRHVAKMLTHVQGNCKFGAKCALAHYLPNGQRVTKADLDASLGMTNRGGFGANNRSSAAPFPPQEAAFPTDQYIPQPFTGPDYFPGQDQFPLLDDEADAYNDRYSQYQATPNFDPTVGSPPTSQFGSPPNDNGFHKPTNETRRSALNAPLPASYDANSLPYIAKYGPFGASVPDKFGMRSPPTSTLSRKLGSPPEPSSLLKNSAIGSSLRNFSSPLNMSPQTTDESIGQRIMHSQKTSRPRMISASLPRSGLHDWEEGVGAEDLLPNSLHDEVLLPQEKMRRPSRPEPELSSSAKSAGLNIPRRSSNVGSPPTGSSPSRFRAFFEEQRKKEESANTNAQNFGHVGSPLRETWMPHDGSDSQRPMQISGISQAMARMELNRTDSSETNGSTRPVSGLRSSSNFSRFDRTISSPGLTGRKIDEEGEGVFFEMDDEGSKRGNSAWTLPQTFPRMQPQDNGSMPAEEGTRTNGSRGIPIIGFRP